jgi:hypothetical protein
MAYTLTQLQAAVEHALGRAPDNRISTTLIIGRALAWLVNAHDWTWKRAWTSLDIAGIDVATLSRSSNVCTATTTGAHNLEVGQQITLTDETSDFAGNFVVATVPGTSTVTWSSTGTDGSATNGGTLYSGRLSLPTNFAQLIDIRAGGLNYTRVRQVTWQEIVDRRRNSVYDSWHLNYCLGQSRATATNTAATWALELAPVPQADTAAALTVIYRRQFYVPGSASAVADIPEDVQELLYCAVRWMAVQTDAPASEELQHLERLMLMELETCRNRDRGRDAADIGPVRGSLFPLEPDLANYETYGIAPTQIP